MLREPGGPDELTRPRAIHPALAVAVISAAAAVTVVEVTCHGQPALFSLVGFGILASAVVVRTAPARQLRLQAAWYGGAAAILAFCVAWGFVRWPVEPQSATAIVVAALVGLGALLGVVGLAALTRSAGPAWRMAAITEMGVSAASTGSLLVALRVISATSGRGLSASVEITAEVLAVVTAMALVVLFRFSAAHALPLRTVGGPIGAGLIMIGIASVLLATPNRSDEPASAACLIAGVTLVLLGGANRVVKEARPAAITAEIGGSGFTLLAALIPVVSAAAVCLTEHNLTFGLFASLLACTTLLVVWRLRLAIESQLASRRHAEFLESYHRSVLDNIADLVLVLDRDGRARYVSPAAETLLGWPAAELIGGVGLDAVHPDDRAIAQSLLDQVLSGEPGSVDGELRLITAGGSTLLVQLSATRLLASEDDPEGAGSIVIGLHDVSEQRRLGDELAHRATHDELTDLPNRVSLFERCAELLGSAAAPARPVAVLFIDIDNFKDLNDTFGHSTGDALLGALGQRLKSAVGNDGLVGRLGGDEFGIVLHGDSSEMAALAVGEQILELMKEPVCLDDDGGAKPVPVSVSIGIAVERGVSAEELLRDADVALYRAKSSGKRRTAVFEPSMVSEVKSRFQLEADLRDALEMEQFFLVYQPVVQLATGQIHGVEALLRWRHPERGLVAPAEFIPTLEESGLILAVGDWVLREATMQTAHWQRMGLPLDTAINVSARQLDSEGLVTSLRESLETSLLHPSSLIVEVTETVLADDPEATAKRLAALRALGVRIAIDDFGTGYSSLSRLRRFPLDVLKIDQSFVAGIPQASHSVALTRTMIHMAQDLGLTTVAEGIETEEQLLVLRAEGCVSGQGFLFARPLEAEDVERLVADQQAAPMAISSGPRAAQHETVL
jgi:diguanylate cyclase (GGDEF)-like protein/PAS domain S-box-containing protein